MLVENSLLFYFLANKLAFLTVIDVFWLIDCLSLLVSNYETVVKVFKIEFGDCSYGLQAKELSNDGYGRIDDLCQGKRGSISAVFGPWQ